MIGQTIAHYRITAKLGEGGMGEVASHHDTKLRLELANVLRQSLVFDSWPEQDILRAVLTIAGENSPSHQQFGATPQVSSAFPADSMPARPAKSRGIASDNGD